MNYIQTSFQINSTSKISSFISWKRFKSDEELLETIEDFLFWKIMQESDEWENISKEEVFKALEKNIWM